MKKIFISTIFTLYLLFNAVPLKAQQRDSLLSAHIDSLLTKEKIKILITDSGLGGLSVAAEIEKIITNAHMFKEAEIIFVNALPDANFRYNSMPDESTKVKFFDKTLIGMEQWFHPDIIFIACNTLSVVYPESEYYKHGNIPVVGIVDLGVNLIQKKLTQYPDSKVIRSKMIPAINRLNDLIRRHMDTSINQTLEEMELDYQDGIFDLYDEEWYENIDIDDYTGEFLSEIQKNYTLLILAKITWLS